jgi:hypothetical protein
VQKPLKILALGFGKQQRVQHVLAVPFRVASELRRVPDGARR